MKDEDWEEYPGKQGEIRVTGSFAARCAGHLVDDPTFSRFFCHDPDFTRRVREVVGEDLWKKMSEGSFDEYCASENEGKRQKESE